MKMKFPFSLLALALVVSLASCDKDDPKKKSEGQQQLEKLTSTWTIQSAVNDGEDRTEEFDGFTLTLGGGSYAENNTYNYSVEGLRPNPSPWPASGTWKFGTNKTTEIIRDPATDSEISVAYQVTDSQLTLYFEVPDAGGWPGTGRIEAVSGDWVFTLTK